MNEKILVFEISWTLRDVTPQYNRIRVYFFDSAISWRMCDFYSTTY